MSSLSIGSVGLSETEQARLESLAGRVAPGLEVECRPPGPGTRQLPHCLLAKATDAQLVSRLSEAGRSMAMVAAEPLWVWLLGSPDPAAVQAAGQTPFRFIWAAPQLSEELFLAALLLCDGRPSAASPVGLHFAQLEVREGYTLSQIENSLLGAPREEISATELVHALRDWMYRGVWLSGDDEVCAGMWQHLRRPSSPWHVLVTAALFGRLEEWYLDRGDRLLREHVPEMAQLMLRPVTDEAWKEAGKLSGEVDRLLKDAGLTGLRDVCPEGWGKSLANPSAWAFGRQSSRRGPVRVPESLWRRLKQARPRSGESRLARARQFEEALQWVWIDRGVSCWRECGDRPDFSARTKMVKKALMAVEVPLSPEAFPGEEELPAVTPAVTPEPVPGPVPESAPRLPAAAANIRALLEAEVRSGRLSPLADGKWVWRHYVAADNLIWTDKGSLLDVARAMRAADLPVPPDAGAGREPLLAHRQAVLKQLLAEFTDEEFDQI